MKTSISLRLTCLFATLLIVIMLISNCFLRTSLFSSLENLMQKELIFRHSLMAKYISTQGSASHWSNVKDKIATLTEHEGRKVDYLVLSKDRKFNLGGEVAEKINYDGLPEGFSTVQHQNESYPLYILVETLKPLGERPEVKFIVAIKSKPYYATLNEFTRSLVFISLAGLILVVMLSYFLARYGLRPVRKLSEQANCLAPGKQFQRLDCDTLPDELYSLAVSFNGVLERQEVAWKQLESFNANVAHELRTPLTNLIGQTQLGLSRPEASDELGELLESNLEELGRMASIVNDMLFLSHAQAGQHAVELSQVSLREETHKTCEYVEPSFLEKNINIDVIGDVQVMIDKRLFHRALANLLENSARYAIAGSSVGVALSQRGHFAYIAVSNVGEPIEPQHLSRLFERFYRVDEARNLSSVHHGLGLAIVKAVALMHGGEAFARSENGVNTFGFTLRIRAPDGVNNRTILPVSRVSVGAL